MRISVCLPGKSLEEKKKVIWFGTFERIKV
jgi:hypothetical protein